MSINSSSWQELCAFFFMDKHCAVPTTAPSLLYLSPSPAAAPLQGGSCCARLAEQSPLTRRDPPRLQPCERFALFQALSSCGLLQCLLIANAASPRWSGDLLSASLRRTAHHLSDLGCLSGECLFVDCGTKSKLSFAHPLMNEEAVLDLLPP